MDNYCGAVGLEDGVGFGHIDGNCRIDQLDFQRTSLPLFVLMLLWLLVSQEKLPNVGSLVASDVLAPRRSFGVAQ